MHLSELIRVVAPPLCWGCRATAGRHDPLCRRCRGALRWLPAEPVPLDGLRAWAPLAYEGPARELVRALKFRSAVRLVEPMAAAMAANAPPGWLAQAPALVPVPLPSNRARERGFNQAKLLASALGERAGLALSECLERDRAPRQVGRPRFQRASVEGVRASGPAPPRALLVDDVITTGATLAACARALRAAGSLHVAGIAFARTLAR